MPEWLPASPDSASVSAQTVALRLVLSAGFGIGVAAVYFLTQNRKRAEAASFVATLVLLSILLAMVAMVIGSNVARAFSLVGALAIVRFRTVVEDTRDTAFVIFAVVTGMAVGAGAYMVPAIGTPIVAVVAWCLQRWGGPPGPALALPGTGGRLVVRLGIGSDPAGPLAETLTKHLCECRLIGIATARQGAANDLSYTVRLREGVSALALTIDLNRIEGVQSVEWSQGKDSEAY